MENTEQRLSNIEKVLGEISKIFENHNKLLQNISDKLKQHDEMFVETANKILEGKKDNIRSVNLIKDNTNHIQTLFENVAELNEQSKELYSHINSLCDILK